LAATKLRKDGMEVLAAGEYAEAMKIMETETPDLIILDLVLPGVDGFGILEKIRENPKFTKTPVIIFSNLSDDKDIKHAQDLGANEFMIKSNFTLDELSAKIKQILNIE
jgi:DNA-binding response OmpR family regulator